MKSKSHIGHKFASKKTIIISIFILIVLGVIGGIVYMVVSKTKHNKPTTTITTNPTTTNNTIPWVTLTPATKTTTTKPTTTKPTTTTTTTKPTTTTTTTNPTTTKPKTPWVTLTPATKTTTTKPITPTVPDIIGIEWLDTLYKKLNWAGQPIKAGSKESVSVEWQKWAKQNKNAILQYYVNYRMNTQGSNCYESLRNFWPTSGQIEFNPVYTWEGLVAAVKLWNTVVEINAKSSDKPLGNLTGFCDEQDMNLRLMSLASFLANATVESAYFMVCKESTKLATDKTTYCPGNKESTGTDRYNPRYCNNCDNADPITYSCKGTGNTGSAIMCDFANGTCNECAGCCASNNLCYTEMGKAECDLNKWKWCAGTSETKPTSNFNPITDNCTGGWPTCERGESFPFPFPLFSTDPCMSDPHADGSMRDKLDNKTARCSDWNGNKWGEQQQCYFGRGLIQLTWSCNYYKVQTIFTRMVSVLESARVNDSLSKEFIDTMKANFNTNTSTNVCANPDVLCGDYKLNGNNVIYSSSLTKQAIPWLACLAYWSFGVNPTWLKCYSFAAAYAGIAPSGAGAYPDRLKAYLQLLNVMGVPDNYYQITRNNSDEMANICISPEIKASCDSCGGGAGGGGNSGNYVCGITWEEAMKSCGDKSLSCSKIEDCAKFNKPGETYNCFAGCP